MIVSIVLSCLMIVIFPFLTIYAWIKQLFRFFNHSQVIDDDLSRKVVLISGCDSGFGYNCVITLAQQEKLRIVACCLTDSGGSALKTALQSNGVDALVDIKTVNITDEKSVAKLHEFIKDDIIESRNLELWAIINNAGITGELGPDEWLTAGDFEKCMQVNFIGHVRMTQTFLPYLIKSGGRIVFSSSVGGKIPLPLAAPYTASKYAMIGYAEFIRSSHWERNPVWVSIVLPGCHATPMMAVSNQRQEIRKRWDKLDDETKALAPAKLVEPLLKSIESVGPLNDPQKVVDAYVHAVTAKYPYPQYWVGVETPMTRFSLFMPIDARMMKDQKLFAGLAKLKNVFSKNED